MDNPLPDEMVGEILIHLPLDQQLLYSQNYLVRQNIRPNVDHRLLYKVIPQNNLHKLRTFFRLCPKMNMLIELPIYGMMGVSTALMWASEEGWTESVRGLLDGGANPSSQNRFGHTALMFACTHGHVDVIRMLIDTRQSCPNFADKLGWTALIYACRQGNIEAVRLLLENENEDGNDYENALNISLELGYDNIARKMINRLQYNLH